MSFLVDTNVLLRSIDIIHPMNFDAVNSLTTLRDRGEEIYIVPQNLIELWNVCTRPKDRNGLGYNTVQAEAEINRIKTLFPLLLDTPPIYREWERLVITYKVSGVNVHDARLVAAMLVRGMTHILTFNVDDFTRYSEIIVVCPTRVSS
ncbi:PIN domain-containing protein [Oscillatoria sp. FACHB-1406]|uniref:type II toxin-antitoxin system VapC family toxin n=1 Tax=Oscillatoria sp. FACHB-1406 TaxID=2692846 RepID=UPI00168547C6|nr:PIN domain-containing protein [Oscillatoria sp. FACHB-1406]MBD2577175.1 type II toxin-antitoxin system VapC family toxin [Oscillatoria sp. FACHB-1406]